MIGFAEMTNDKCQSTRNDKIRITRNRRRSRLRHSGFVINSSFVIRSSSFRPERAFTIVELLIVIVIILILAGLILSVSSYVQDKGKRSRAETEIAAMSAALENYKADNGIYPRGNANLSTSAPYDTDTLDPKTNTNPTATAYQKASLYLFFQLSGLNTSQQPVANMKSYFAFKPGLLGHVPTNNPAVAFIRDPWGNSYGYSTALATTPGGSAGYNPTFDLWSTAGTGAGTTPTPSPAPTAQNQWIKNW